MPTPAPFSVRLSEHGRETLNEVIELSGYKRSIAIEIAVRKYRDELLAERAAAEKRKSKKPVVSAWLCIASAIHLGCGHETTATRKGNEMNATELNALPHGTPEELNAIPSIRLTMILGPKFLLGSKTRLFDAVEVEGGWEGCVRLPGTGNFAPRQLYSRENYKV